MIKMQQRPTSRTTQSLDDERSPPKTTDQEPDYRLPLYNRRNVKKDGEFSQTKWVHVIPLILILSAFILWCFSYPVEVAMNDGKILAIHRLDAPLHLNETNHVELAILATATATSPIASLPVNLTEHFDAVNLTEHFDAVNLTTYLEAQSQPMVSNEVEETDHVPISAATH